MKMITLPNTDRKLHEAMGDLKAALHGVEGAIKGEVQGTLRSRLQSTVDQARRRCHQLEKRASAGAHQADAWVHERPYLLAGTALVAGALLGAWLLIRR